MIQIKLFWNAAILAFFAAATMLTPQASRAAIIENIFEAGTQNFLGTISFPAISGSDAAGVDLSLILSGSLPPFTESDITFIHWELNPVNFSVLDLFLNALQGDNPCPDSAPCSNFTLELRRTQVAGVGVDCNADGLCSIADFFPTDVEYRVAVPEPGGFAILVVGLIGMGMVLWQGRRKGQTRPIHTVAGCFVRSIVTAGSASNFPVPRSRTS